VTKYGHSHMHSMGAFCAIIISVALVICCQTLESKHISVDTNPIYITYDMDIDKYNRMYIHGNEEERKYAAQILSIANDESSYEYAMKALQENELYIRVSAIKILGNIGDFRSVEKLVEIAGNDNRVAYNDISHGWDHELTVSDIARDAIVNHNLKLTHKQIRKLLDNPDTVLKSIGVEALGVDLANQSIESPAKYLKDKDWRIRRAAVSGISKHISLNPITLLHLESAINDKNQEVREEAIIAYDKLKSAEVMSALIGHFESENNPRLKVMIMRAMAKYHNTRVMDIAIKYSYSWNNQYKYESSRYLAEYNTLEAYASLERLLSDDDSVIRGYALIGLAKLKGSESLLHVHRFFTSKEYSDRRAAVQAYGEIGGSEVSDLLVDAITRKEGDGLEGEIVKSLAKIKDNRAVQISINILSDAQNYSNYNFMVINDCAIALEKMVGNQVCDHIAPFLKHYHPSVRMTALEILGRQAGKEYIDKIKELLRDDDHDIRNATISVIAGFSVDKSVLPAIEALNDAYPPVRNKALAFLKYYTKLDYGKDEIKWRQWWATNAK